MRRAALGIIFVWTALQAAPAHATPWPLEQLAVGGGAFVASGVAVGCGLVLVDRVSSGHPVKDEEGLIIATAVSAATAAALFALLAVQLSTAPTTAATSATRSF